MCAWAEQNLLLCKLKNSAFPVVEDFHQRVKHVLHVWLLRNYPWNDENVTVNARKPFKGLGKWGWCATGQSGVSCFWLSGEPESGHTRGLSESVEEPRWDRHTVGMRATRALDQPEFRRVRLDHVTSHRSHTTVWSDSVQVFYSSCDLEGPNVDYSARGERSVNFWETFGLPQSPISTKRCWKQRDWHSFTETPGPAKKTGLMVESSRGTTVGSI